jgi:hypothetical protein
VHNEAHRGCLSAQQVLSMADIFSLVFQLHPRQLQNPIVGGL